MESIKLLFLIYIRPGFAFSEIIDRGSWLVAAGLALGVAFVFFLTIQKPLHDAYASPEMFDYHSEFLYTTFDPQQYEQRRLAAIAEYNKAMAERQQVPLFGDRFFSFSTFEYTGFYRPFLTITVLFVPAVILFISLIAAIGSFGLLLRREYTGLATCIFLGWAAAHLPFALLGVAASATDVGPYSLFWLWISSGIVFGVLSVLAVRTVFGTSLPHAALAVALAFPMFWLATYVFQYTSMWMLSPFLFIWALIFFGAFLGGEVRSLGHAFRQRQDMKRFLQNATVNPRDADAHVQLGLIYLSRRQTVRASDHFRKAVEIDNLEIDANFELGKLALARNELQNALDYFGIVLEQDDRFRLSEIWREIGAAYLRAEMWKEAAEALETFVDRRPVDPEGLYYFGRTLKALGENERSREMFAAAIESARSSPHYRSRQLSRWSKLAAKEL